MNRFAVSSSAGQKGDCRFAVVDRHDMQGGKGMRRVSWHRTQAQAHGAARRLNSEQVPKRAQSLSGPHYTTGHNRDEPPVDIYSGERVEL